MSRIPAAYEPVADLRARCEEVRRSTRLSSIAAKSLKLTRAGREWKACCPFHADRTPSFTIYADDRRFMCFGCGAEGDLLDFLMRLHGIGLLDALAMVDGGAFPTVVTAPTPSNETHRGHEATAIWDAASRAAGTVVESYLRSRALTLPIPPSIRFANIPLGTRPAMPALVAAVSTLSGAVEGIQRTYLKRDGAGKAALPGGKAKFSLGRVRGGAIRLADPAAELIVTEGLEDGLTLLQELGKPVWVAAGAGMMPAMELPDTVTSVIIGADADGAGERAAQTAADAFSLQGRSVRIIRPLAPYKDFNEELMADGQEPAA